MAKWGEGDPRWIVEERPDATNVNNWHWYEFYAYFPGNAISFVCNLCFFRTEKNATEWSKNRFRVLFEGLVIDDGALRCEIMKVSESNGEACANNRKSKLIFFYEWHLELDWSGKWL